MPYVAAGIPMPSDSARAMALSHSAAVKSGARETKICSSLPAKAIGKSFDGTGPIAYLSISGGSYASPASPAWPQ